MTSPPRQFARRLFIVRPPAPVIANTRPQDNRWARRVWRLLLPPCLVILASGCNPPGTSPLDEEKDPNFLIGKSRVNTSNYGGAVEAFEKALEANPRSASAHKELGLLHYQRLSDHAAAIYHFQKLLELRPKDPHAEIIKQHILACKQELASSVALGPLNQRYQTEIDQLRSENARLDAELGLLRRKILELQSPTSSPPARILQPTNPPQARVGPLPTPPSPDPPRSAAPNASSNPAARGQSRVHRVVKGENPHSIARRYRVSPQALLDANPGINPRNLRPGQTLKIPAR